MNTDSGRTKSVWMTTTAESGGLAPLASDIECEICIVGAGIAGITTAYIASQQGRRVVVLDDGPIGGGETARTTAHLVNALDDRFYELERLHGEEGSRLAAESHSAAIDFIERTVAQEKIDCDFQRLDGYLFLAPGEKLEHINWELEAAHRAGLTAVQRVERAPI